mmetsp:Transcript_34505/g.64347  ORF Transcript_34505/g.64347 Transcript_34505/m.64347 type:complete len:220 (+) Transcript_34505:260-919(+)
MARARNSSREAGASSQACTGKKLVVTSTIGMNCPRGAGAELWVSRVVMKKYGPGFRGRSRCRGTSSSSGAAWRVMGVSGAAQDLARAAILASTYISVTSLVPPPMSNISTTLEPATSNPMPPPWTQSGGHLLEARRLGRRSDRRAPLGAEVNRHTQHHPRDVSWGGSCTCGGRMGLRCRYSSALLFKYRSTIADSSSGLKLRVCVPSPEGEEGDRDCCR